MQSGRVSDPMVICLLGEVSRGKSALLNALVGKPVCKVSARAGQTKEIARVRFQHPRWADGLPVVFIDTPGLQELAGGERAQVALDAAMDADLVLCVIDGDITQTEYECIVNLNEHAKPIIVTINKSDTFDRKQLATVENKVSERLRNIIQPEYILSCAADPLVRQVVVQGDDSEIVTEKNAPPDIAKLRQIIGDTLAREDANLIRIRQLETLEIRRNEIEAVGNDLVDEYSFGIAVGVAINPVPLVDFLGAGAAILGMIYHLAEKLDIKMTEADTKNLADSLWKSARGLLGNIILGTVLASAVKSIPLLGTIIGCAVQAGLGGYVAYIIGRTAVKYLAAGCSWEGRSAHEIMQEVIENTDKDAIVAQIQDRLKKKFPSSHPPTISTPKR